MSIAPLRNFVAAMTRLVEHHGQCRGRCPGAGPRFAAGLVAYDDWLPEPFRRQRPDRYRQYLLYGDPLERFTLVSFVWGPGQRTPVHDHLMWGLVGMLRGREHAVPYTRAAGRPRSSPAKSRLGWSPAWCRPCRPPWGHPHRRECTA